MSNVSRMILDDDLQPVTVLWSQKYACPVFVEKDGTKYVPLTGEFAGYYEEYYPPARPVSKKEGV